VLKEAVIGALPETTADDECQCLRRELQVLRRDREKLREFRCNEVKQLECQYQTTKDDLRCRLLERSNSATYKKSLRHYRWEQFENKNGTGKGSETSNNIRSDSFPNSGRAITSCNYIVQQETPILSAMHRTFLVFPNQIQVFEGEYERKIYPYFRKEIQALHIESLEVLDYWMRRLTEQVADNQSLYASYRTKLEGIEAEVQNCKDLLLLRQRKDGKNLRTGFKKDCDEEISLSGTVCSSDSDNEIQIGTKVDRPNKCKQKHYPRMAAFRLRFRSSRRRVKSPST